MKFRRAQMRFSSDELFLDSQDELFLDSQDGAKPPKTPKAEDHIVIKGYVIGHNDMNEHGVTEVFHWLDRRSRRIAA